MSTPEPDLPTEPRTYWDRLNALAPAVVLVVSLTVTFAVWHWKNQEEFLRGQNRFSVMVTALIADINDRISHFEQLLRVSRGILAHDEGMTTKEWQAFVEHLDIDQEYQGMDGLAVVVSVAAAERENFESSQRLQQPDFHIHPAGERPEYWVNRIAAPERAQRAIGFDVGSTPERRRALEQSRDSGSFSISDPVRLITTITSEPSLLIYLATYSGNGIPATIEERRKLFLSWVGVAFRVSEMMKGVMSESVGLDIDLFYGTTPSQEMKMFDSSPERDDMDKAGNMSRYSSKVIISVADTKWLVYARSMPEFEAEFSSGMPIIFLIGGVLLSWSLTLVVWLFRSSSERAQIIAQNMTRDLRVSEEKYRGLIETQFDMVLRIGLDGKFTFANETTCQVLGLTQDELFERNWQDFVHPDDQQETADEIIAALSLHKSRVTVTNRIITKAGERWFSWEGAAVSGYDRSEREVQAIGRDITLSKIDEQRIKELNELNNIIISKSPIGILAYSSDGQCITANNAVARIVGGTTDALLTQNFIDIKSWKDNGLYGSALEALTRNDMVCRHNVLLSSTFGRSFWADYYFVPFYSAGQPHLLTMINDATAWHDAQDELTEAKHRAESADRAKSEFLAMMSHELRTPLNSILGFAELIRDQSFGPIDNPQYVEYSEYIHTSGNHLLQLLNDILDLAKIEAGKMTLSTSAISISALLDDCNRLFRTKASAKGISLSVHNDIGDAVVLADERSVRQMLFNFLSNAIKFTDTGSVTFRAKEQGRRGDIINVVFEVRDTGIGISPKQQNLLFKPFTQLAETSTRRFDGTGLGLVITQRLVDMMGGKIGIESESGKGSLFWFSLPLRIAATTPLPSGGASSQPTTVIARPLHILVAEDNPINQMLVRSILRKGGHTVEVVDNGRLAVEAVTSGDFDLVLMDMQMPVMSGEDATRVIRSMPPPKNSLPIIALTADAMLEHRERYLGSGVTDLVAKPVDVNTLLGTIEAHSKEYHG